MDSDAVLFWLGMTGLGLIVAMLGVVAFTVRGSHWGATPAERTMPMPGDEYFEESTNLRVVMTRGISIQARPEIVWRWLAQLGRGAGWYSIDWLDNGRRVSASHLVSWIPEVQKGDANAIGYLRHIVPGRDIAWWAEGERYLGVSYRMAIAFRVTAIDERLTRFVMRVTADGAGRCARPVLAIFQFIDSIMARRQLLGFKERAERFGARTCNPQQPETGARDQFQLFEVIYATGESAGVAGREHAAHWRQNALRDLGN